MPRRTTYGSAIREGFEYLLARDRNVFVLGQGLWSPWYVGNSMTDLDKKFGKDRVIDTPVSEQACTGAAVGAAIAGKRPIVVHPRVDFMLLAADQIVTQAAKWSSMFGGKSRAPVVFRGIVNRGGEQGAQHSQSLHSWFAHIPGLRVVLPATVQDARDMLVSAVYCDDPVLYMDDRWLYDLEGDINDEPDHSSIYRGPQVLESGTDITIVASGYSVRLVKDAAVELAKLGISAEIIDLRVLNPLDTTLVVESVAKTGRLLVVDGDWRNCGIAGEVIARVVESGGGAAFMAARPQRITLPDAPAPTSRVLEEAYYPSAAVITDAVVRAVTIGQPVET